MAFGDKPVGLDVEMLDQEFAYRLGPSFESFN